MPPILKLEALLDNPVPLDEDDLRYAELLKDLQGNILTAHGKSRAHYFFIRFRDGQSLKARYLIGMLASNMAERAIVFQALRSNDVLEVMPTAIRALIPDANTSEGPLLIKREQYEQIKHLTVVSELELRKGRRADWAAKQQGLAPPDLPRETINLLLTRSGYAKLGESVPDDEAFNDGMDARSALNDPRPESWDNDYRSVDALLILGYEGDQVAKISALGSIIATHAELVFEERGEALRAAPRGAEPPQPIEPFGFRDGLSQPAFYGSDQRRMQRMSASSSREDATTTTSRWDPFAPLNLVLCPDPNGRTRHACGSYFVFRKLQQDVAKFHHQLQALAERSGDLENAQGAVFGRSASGAPLFPTTGINGFDYTEDSGGKVCPFHTHIRKTNPRKDIPENYAPRQRRIVRRGMPYSYGPPIPRHSDGMPVLDGKISQNVGMLFLCAQRVIKDQFEKIQASWANNPNSPSHKSPGIDPIIGQLPPGDRYLPPFGLLDAAGRGTWEPVVHMKGGAYFFAPSKSFLKGLLHDIWNEA